MIKLINLQKTYKQKNIKVDALKSINLTFPDKGMVFITGVSGTGKSTLLNIIGGLDTFDEGDIIIDGVSLKNFKEKDINNYRNSYVGFVFQEFNLIEEYNIKENIRLGCNKEIEENKIGEILEKVNLKGLENRKPNTLSGGQRQRVSIARALVKEPKLLLCDEPTGQLDKETSKTIFEILKEISKESLVIVVSHDEENAKKYADEIIKIEDGIANNKEEEIKENDFTLEEFKLTKKNYITLANGFLRSKITRLIIAMIISIMVFVMIGVSDTISSYDKNKAILESLYENDNRYVPFNKEVKVNDEIHYLNLNDDDVEILTNKLKNYEYDLIYNFMNGLKIKTKETINFNDYYYKNEISGTCEINSELINRYNLELIAGRLPNDYNEIVITKYIYEMYKKYGYSNGSDSTDILSYEDILNKTIKYEYKDYKIVGILDTKLNKNYFSILENYIYESENEEKMSRLNEEIYVALEYGIHNVIFIKEGFYNKITKDKCLFNNLNSNIILEKNGNLSRNKIKGIKKEDDFSKYEIVWKDEPLFHLESNQVIVPLLETSGFKYQLEQYCQSYLSNYAKENYLKEGYSSEYEYEVYLKNNKLDIINHAAKLEFFDIYFTNAKINVAAKYENIEVVGVYSDQNSDEIESDSLIIVGDEYYSDLKYRYSVAFSQYTRIIFKLYNEKEKDLKLLNLNDYSYKNNEYNFAYQKVVDQKIVKFHLEAQITLKEIDRMMQPVATILKYFSLVLAIILCIFMCFYFQGVINIKQKDIGILRALGATKKNITNIFIIQGIMLLLISIISSTALSLILVKIINNIIINKEFLNGSIYFFELKQFMMFVLIDIIILTIGILIPLIKLLKKKPIEIISKR